MNNNPIFAKHTISQNPVQNNQQKLKRNTFILDTHPPPQKETKSLINYTKKHRYPKISRYSITNP